MLNSDLIFALVIARNSILPHKTDRGAKYSGEEMKIRGVNTPLNFSCQKVFLAMPAGVQQSMRTQPWCHTPGEGWRQVSYWAGSTVAYADGMGASR